MKFEFWFLTKSWNHLSFVNVSPALVIDTSMERSSRVLHHGNAKIWIFFQKSLKFKFWLSTNSWNHHSFDNSYQSYISNWYINGKVFTSTTPWKFQNLNFFPKKIEIRILTFEEQLKSPYSFVKISPTLEIDASMEWSSQVLHNEDPKIRFFQKSSNFDFWRRAEITLSSSISVLH